MRIQLTTLIALFLTINLAQAQNDSIIVSDHTIIVGKIKKIDRDIITIDTDFSKNNIRIEREKIHSIIGYRELMLTDREGLRIHGTLRSVGKDSIYLSTEEHGTLKYHWDDLYNLEEYRKSFKQRFSFSIDIGFSMAKANDLIQWSSSGNIGYKADNWIIESNFNGIISSQEDTETIYRWDQQIEFDSFLPKNWFIHSELGFLTSSEQKIDVRFVPRVGVGKILIRFNEINWNITGGGNMNFERYLGNAEDRRTVELFFGTDLNIIDLDDFNLTNRNSVFKSMTENDRWRVDSTTELRYKLPLKLYVSAGFTYNYDCSPTEGAEGTDYVLRTGVGWEL